MNKTEELMNKLGLTAINIELFELALTHPSANSESKTHNDYEKLEFIGDSVLGFASADLIYKYRPEMDQGLMTKLRSLLVRKESLAKYGRQIELYNYIKTGHSINEEQLKKSDKILEDVFEALIGAINLTFGVNEAYKFVEKYLKEDIIHTSVDELVDAKTKLQEDIQSEYRDAVKYTLTGEEGPAHDRTFYVEVSFNGIVLGKGSGKSKKIAEEAAAKDALSKRSV